MSTTSAGIRNVSMQIGTGTSRGLFVTFEGPEGSGKSTQLRLLAAHLRAMGREVCSFCPDKSSALGAYRLTENIIVLLCFWIEATDRKHSPVFRSFHRFHRYVRLRISEDSFVLSSTCYGILEVEPLLIKRSTGGLSGPASGTFPRKETGGV